MTFATRAEVGFRSERGPVLIALMTTTGLVAIDATILATAVPTIVSELGGFTSFPWLFSIYLLTQAVSVPMYAKVADTIGRKPVILLGIGLFLLGSVLCGVAWSMPALIAFRALQGLGAGAVQPMSVTIVGDIYTLAERARVQGYIASVWGVASVVGPTLGGVFSQFLSWRWIFFVNLPLGLVAAWLLVRRYHESVEHREHRIDWLGGAILTVGLSLVILATLEGGNAWAWDAWQSVGAYGLGGSLLVVFAAVERRAAEPVLPMWVFSRRLLATTATIAVGVGAMLLGVTTYVPTFLEALLGVTPLTSGLTLAMLTIGWPISASQAGRVYLRIGFRSTAMIGVGVVIVGTVGLAVVSATPSVLLTGLSCFAIGAGLGFVAAPSLIAAQSSVQWGERAVVTGTNMFSRSMGSAVGVAVLGALVNGVMRDQSAAADPALFGTAATRAFWTIAGVAVLTAVAVLAMPRDRPAA
ncbi:MFS transporter [Isoptericola sp. b441]|uniref:MFS transporter n=1 Tax=Actinotalea lenta TaxID=3064654 RepID=A0ABT9DA39_9CELL|nr:MULTISPECIES: MFS transporter [unclassified Isoptericola]MDO8106048.1 MFS transporter [Isoptericola sp. b441]MDO8122233.1 MFS transporter [Isoptericola sp. b490]